MSERKDEKEFDYGDIQEFFYARTHNWFTSVFIYGFMVLALNFLSERGKDNKEVLITLIIVSWLIANKVTGTELARVLVAFAKAMEQKYKKTGQGKLPEGQDHNQE